MFLKTRDTGILIEIRDLFGLMNPLQMEIIGIPHAGEELQEPEAFAKRMLLFPSGEELPLCWRDVAYRLHPLHPPAEFSDNPGIPPRQHLAAR